MIDLSPNLGKSFDISPFDLAQGKPQIDFADFAKLDLRVGEVVEAKEVEGSEKLVEMKVDFGSEIGRRTVYAGIKKWYTPDSLIGRKAAFVVNLAPKSFKIRTARKSSRTLRSSASPAGLWEIKEYVSEGMMVAAGRDEAVLYSFDKNLEPGTSLK